MDVTELNFKEILPEVQSAIANATFISIDTEFSALEVNNSTSVTWYDSPKEAYAKLQKLGGVAVLQYGLCTFHEDPENPKKFFHRGYNFYILPCSNDFICQTDSLVFLVKNGMDLNKVFAEGISNLKPTVQETKIADLQQQRKDLESPARTPKPYSRIENIPEVHKEFLDKTKALVEEFLADDSKDELILEWANGFQRLLLHQMLEADFDNKAFLMLRPTEKRNRELVVFKGGDEEKRSKQIEQLLNDEIALKNNSGFLSVLSTIQECGKIVVGHNMILDILHTVNQFYEDLPKKLDDFKKTVHSKFPKIIDTKMMSCRKPLCDRIESSILPSLVKTLSMPPFNLEDADIEDGAKGYSLKCDKAHEAGFDAYATGLCFIAMARYLSKGVPIAEALQSDCLKPFINKLMFSAYKNEGGYFDLCVDNDPETPLDHVFHMTVPSDWVTSKIIGMYSAFGGASVNWLNKEECLVSLNRPQESDKVKATMEKAARKSKAYKFQTAAQYKASKCTPSYQTGGRRRKSSENQSEQSAAKKHKNANGSSETTDASSTSASNMFKEDPSWE